MRRAIALIKNKHFHPSGAILGFICLTSLLFLAGCGDKQAAAFERPPAPVTVAVAIAQDVPTYIDAVGKTVAREVVSIQPQVSGRITEIQFTDGSHLKTGDMLFTIDPRPYEASLHEAVASLVQRKAELELAEIAFARATELVAKDFIPKEDYDTRKNGVDVAKAMVQQAEAAVETARLNLEYCTIRSPIDGRAGHRLIDVGNVVKPENNTAILVIERMNPIYADFTITENDLTAVQQNMAKGVLKAEVGLPDDPDGARQGELSFLDNSVQDGTGTIKLRATIPNTDEYFWPGRFVRVRLVLNTLRSAILVPATASQMSAQGSFVYVIKQDSTAELRPVTVGQRQGDLVVVAKGLKSGEQVVTNGQLGVTPGGKVRVEQAVASDAPEANKGEKS
jgi:multidrug efflux system membrane fusion protein